MRSTRTRRWYQFSLRALLLFVTVAAFAAFGWRTFVEPHRQEQQVIALVKQLGGSCETVEAPERWLRWLGATQHVTKVILADCDEPSKYIVAVSQLPKIELLIVGGLNFTDQHAARLHSMRSLKGLILDSTSVSAETMGSLRSALPDANVYASRRRAIAELEKFGSISLCPENNDHAVLIELAGKEWFAEARFYSAKSNGDPFSAKEDADDASLKWLKHLSQLRGLDLRYTRVTDAGLEPLTGLRQLTKLFLTGTKVGDDGLAYLDDLSELTELRLDGAPVTGAGLIFLGGMSQLNRLFLNETEVDDDGLQHLSRLPRLTAIFLRNTNVTDTGLMHLKRMSQLKVLGLQSTRVTDAGMEHLAGLNQLNRLVLAGTQVTDVGLAHLHGLSQLKYLWLGNTRVTDDGCAELRRELPECTIHLQGPY